MITIQQIELPKPGMQQLRAEARQEGFLFIEKLWNEWRSGENRFDAIGELLYGCMEQTGLVAIGGLNKDPFADNSDVGRIRRVYVRPAWRNRGIGTALVRTLIQNARPNFASVSLRTDNPTAARFYERIGFSRSSISNTTHVLNLDKTAEYVARSR